MENYRKKPVVIQATQWDGTHKDMERIECGNPKLVTLSSFTHPQNNVVMNWKIGTLEGGHEVSPQDFIIKGVKGEFYPCKPDVFEMTYEAVE